MNIIGEKYNYDPNDMVLIEALTYYNLELLTYNLILKTLYISKPQISPEESMTIIQLNLPQENEIINTNKSKNRKFKNKNIPNDNYFIFKSSR